MSIDTRALILHTLGDNQIKVALLGCEEVNSCITYGGQGDERLIDVEVMLNLLPTQFTAVKKLPSWLHINEQDLEATPFVVLYQGTWPQLEREKLIPC